MKRKKKKIPAYKFGTEGSMLAGNFKENIGGAISGGTNLLTSAIGSFAPSTATTLLDVVSQSIGDTLGGAASGAQLGASVGGPIGAVVGGAAGLITGAIGKKGGIEQSAGFTQDNNYTLSTGLRGLFGNKKLKRKINQDKQNVQANRIAIANTANLQSEWDEDNNYDTYTFANGGEMLNDLAYVDDGELIQTPDGIVSKVPENGNPTDTNLINLPGGSTILSDKLKVPGTNKTFAEIGEKMMSKKRSKGRDKYAENANKLNDMNDKQSHDMLFELLEQVKLKKGIKPKTKAFADGGRKYPWQGVGSLKDIYDTTDYGNTNMYGYTDSNIPEVTVTAPRITKQMWSGQNLQELPISTEYNIPTTSTTTAGMPTSTSTNKSNKFNLNGLSDIVSSISSLAPVMSNIFSSNTETIAPEYNPYEDTIARTMRKRRFDVNPAINLLNRNRAISNYNADQVNTNTGANLAYRLQTAGALDKNTLELYAQASNIQSQYDADYASTLNNLGQQRVGATNLAKDVNMKSRAANRNIRRAGLSQLSEWAQNQALMYNQKSRDNELLPLYARFLQAGFTESDLLNILKHKK